MNNHRYSLTLGKEITEEICRDLELEVPNEWGDDITLWYGSTLAKGEWGWYVVGSLLGDKNNLRKDILHILKHFDS
jgi:hypothetical protein